MTLPRQIGVGRARALFGAAALAWCAATGCSSKREAKPEPTGAAATRAHDGRKRPHKDRKNLPGKHRRRDGGASAAAPDTPAADTAAPAATAAAEAPAGPEGKILCFGDSITQADWPGKIEPNEKWVTVLGSKSNRITTVNAGRNGRTTTEGLAELPKALEANPDAAYVLFFLGVNDTKHGKPGVVEKATANMGKMVDLAREKLPKAQIVLLAPINVNVEKFTPFFKGEEMGPDTAHYMKAMSVAYRALAEKKGVRFIDLLDVVTPANIEDGVHANGKGQAQIAEAVWKGLVEIGKSKGAGTKPDAGAAPNVGSQATPHPAPAVPAPDGG